MYYEEKRCKICIFYHVPERELNSCLMIADMVKKLAPNAQIIIEEFYQGTYLSLLFRPDVILTIPPRDRIGADRLTIVKRVVGCTVISLLTEGFYQSFSEKDIQVSVGTNRYSPKLIDKYLFWGEKTKESFVNVLKKNGKIENESRAQAVGYTYYDIGAIETYFKRNKLPEDVLAWKKKYKRILLVLTGFPIAEDTKNEQIMMSAFKYHGVKGKKREYRQEVLRWKKRKEDFLLYRKEYLKCITEFAKKHPDIGVLVKLHPVELERFLKGKRYQCYHKLEKYDNIIILKESLLLGRILPYIETLIHYGSTSGLEAYIYDIPTVHLYDSRYAEEKGAPGFCNYESTVKIDVNNFKQFEQIVYAGVKHKYSESVEKVLKEQFNWIRDKKDEYHPVEAYAKIILDSVGKGQKIENDIFCKSAFESDMGYDIKHYFLKRTIQMAVRQEKEESIKCKKVLKELGVTMSALEYVGIELHVIHDKVKRKILKNYSA